MDKKKSLFLKRNKELKNKKIPFSIDLNSIEECSFFVEKHNSLMKDKLYTTFKR